MLACDYKLWRLIGILECASPALIYSSGRPVDHRFSHPWLICVTNASFRHDFKAIRRVVVTAYHSQGGLVASLIFSFTGFPPRKT